MIPITPKVREQLLEALLEGFSYDTLRQMLRLKLGVKLENEVNVNRGFRFVADDLLEIAKDKWLDKLFLKASEYHQHGSTAINNAVTLLQISALENVHVVNIDLEPANHDRLQQLIRKRIPFVNMAQFASQLEQASSRICRIEIQSNPKGTGWLVSPNLVFTNYHVVESIINGENGLGPKDVVCRFDYHREGSANHGRVVSVGGQWLIDSSPYSKSDLGVAGPDPTEFELDYAVLHLDENVGNEMIAGVRRGWFEVSENAPVMSLQDIVMIPQHPQGNVLQLAFGGIVNYNDSANRVCYDANTDHGSSGSPCFDLNMVPFALHQAIGPSGNLLVNQGVPLREIVKSLKSKNTPKFWS